MKVAFDENIPHQMYGAFRGLVGSPSFKHDLCSARDYRPPDERGDVGWVGRFADDGGEIIISGDVAMRANIHERIALSESGMITYFFEPRWGRQNFYIKSAMLLKWWPLIDKHMQLSERGMCWEIPFQWTAADFRDVTPRPDLGIVSQRPIKPKLVSSR